MNAYTLNAPGSLSLEDVPEPDLDDDGVLLRTESCSICSTDVSYFRGHLFPDGYPVVPGHEYVGQVVKVGKALTGRVVEGARLVYWGQGDFDGLAEIRSLRPLFANDATPERAFFTSRNFYDAPQAAAAVVPDTLSSREGTLAEPLTSVLRSLLRTPPAPGSTIVMLGHGPSGALALQVLKRQFAAARIVVLDQNVDRLPLALELGADEALSPVDQRERLDGLQRDFEGAFADYVFDALPYVDPDSPGRASRSIAMCLLRPGGIYNVYGVTALPQEVDWWSIGSKGLHIGGGAAFDTRSIPMRQTSYILRQAVEWLDRGVIDARPLVTETIDWGDKDSVRRAFADYGSGASQKTSINWRQISEKAANARPGELRHLRVGRAAGA